MEKSKRDALVSARLNEIEKKRKAERTRAMTLGVLGVLGFFAAWQILVSIGLISTTYVATPIEALRAIFAKVTDLNPDNNTLLTNVAASFQVAFSGFFMAILVGAPLGLLMGWYKPVEKFFRPLFEIIRPIPPISWIPISILFFGIGVTSKAFIIFFSAFVPTLINSNTGILSTNQVHINVGKTCGASKAKMFFTIGIPSAMPMVFAGFKLSLGNAWSTLVAAEMLASSEGLGYMIIMSRTFSRLDLLIGGMLVIGIIGILLSMVMDIIERSVIRWRYVK